MKDEFCVIPPRQYSRPKEKMDMETKMLFAGVIFAGIAWCIILFGLMLPAAVAIWMEVLGKC